MKRMCRIVFLPFLALTLHGAEPLAIPSLQFSSSRSSSFGTRKVIDLSPPTRIRLST